METFFNQNKMAKKWPFLYGVSLTFWSIVDTYFLNQKMPKKALDLMQTSFQAYFVLFKALVGVF